LLIRRTQRSFPAVSDTPLLPEAEPLVLLNRKSPPTPSVLLVAKRAVSSRPA
jgi:hypothetical protein